MAPDGFGWGVEEHLELFFKHFSFGKNQNMFCQSLSLNFMGLQNAKKCIWRALFQELLRRSFSCI